MTDMSQSPKDAAIILLRRALEEPEPAVVAALISTAIKQIEMPDKRRRQRRKSKRDATPEAEG